MKKLILNITDEEIINELESKALRDGKSVDEEASILLKESISKESKTIRIFAFRSQPGWKTKFLPAKLKGNSTTDQIITDERYSD